MQLIHDFLSRYARLTPPDMVVRKRLAVLLSEELHRTISEKEIRIIGPVAYCALDSALKNALFMKKEAVLQQLEKEFGKKILREIQ